MQASLLLPHMSAAIDSAVRMFSDKYTNGDPMGL